MRAKLKAVGHVETELDRATGGGLAVPQRTFYLSRESVSPCTLAVVSGRIVGANPIHWAGERSGE